MPKKKNTSKSKVWIFPILLFIVLAVFTILRISGTSISIYGNLFYGQEFENTKLIANNSEDIRSDEWLGWTQKVITQNVSNYPTYNELLGDDNDVTKNPEVPEKSWVSIFRPYNLSFFVLTLENAFAFKWWVILYLLIISSYFFILRILKNNIVLAIILSMSFSLSPFIFWWYQVALLIPLAFSLLFSIVAIRVINKEKIFSLGTNSSNFVYAIISAYLLSSIALTIYPPYSVPIGIITALFVLGEFINKYDRKKKLYKNFLRLWPLLVGVLLTLLVIIGYYQQHKNMIEITANSVYPGERRETSGDLTALAYLDGFVMPVINEDDSNVISYYENRSEASNYILLLPYLTIPIILYQIILFYRIRVVDWRLILINMGALLFLARSLLPIDFFFYDFLLLDRVPNKRLLAGIGFAGFLQLILYINNSASLNKLRSKFDKRIIYAVASLGTLLTLFLSFYTSTLIKNNHPNFIKDETALYLYIIVFSTIVSLYLFRKYLAASFALLVFTILSMYKIMPLYQGLEILTENKVIERIQAVSEEGDVWGTADSIYFINFPNMAGFEQTNGSQNYTDFDMWEELAGKEYEDIYNRQARTVYITGDNDMDKLELIQNNYFIIRFDCDDFTLDEVDYMLTVAEVNYPCLEYVEMIDYPKTDFFIYRVTQ